MMTALPAFDNTLGALLVGGLLAMALWGVTCVQTFSFFTRTSRDGVFLRLMITFLWFLDTFHSALDGHILYHYLVTNFLNPAAIGIPVWSVILHVTISFVSDFLIRAMFAHRIYRLSKGNLFITGWIMLVSTTYLGAGGVVAVKAFQISSYSELRKISNVLYLNFATGTASDFSVALAMSWYLMRSRTGFQRTDTIINTLMKYTVNTGLLVGIDAALSLITFVVMPNNFVFLGFYFILSKLYFNSYLAMLNARDDLREMNGEPLSFRSNISTLQRDLVSGGNVAVQMQSSLPRRGSHYQKVAIKVNKVVESGDFDFYTPSPSSTITPRAF